MLPDETCFTPTEVGPSPALSRPSAPPPRPEIVARRSQPPAAPAGAEPPSPWAIAPRSQLTPAQQDDALLGWWALLIAVAILCAAIWLTRYGP
jgi:hypothetical protein